MNTEEFCFDLINDFHTTVNLNLLKKEFSNFIVIDFEYFRRFYIRFFLLFLSLHSFYFLSGNYDIFRRFVIYI